MNDLNRLREIHYNFNPLQVPHGHLPGIPDWLFLFRSMAGETTVWNGNMHYGCTFADQLSRWGKKLAT